MSFTIDNCPHKNELSDTHDGFIVCSDCGLVLDNIYDSSKQINFSSSISEIGNINLKKDSIDFVFEIMERLQVPQNYAFEVFDMIEKCSEHVLLTESFITHCIYTTLQKIGVPFSLTDITSVTGLNSKKFLKERKKNDSSSIIIIESIDILERLCKKLDLDFNQFTLIKENIPNKICGYNPSTVAASYIYLYFRKNKIKKSLKDICFYAGVSCMSVQRYLKKNELSLRA